MKKYSLTNKLIGSHWIENGVLADPNGSFLKGFVLEPLSSGLMEEGLQGPTSENFFSKPSELLTRLPNFFNGQIILKRSKLKNSEVPGFVTQLYAFESAKKPEGYSYLEALFSELKLEPKPIDKNDWDDLLESYLGKSIKLGKIPDLTWEKDHLSINGTSVRALSLTELPQVTWHACLQPIFEFAEEFILSLRFNIPDRQKIRKQLKTKRRVICPSIGYLS